MWFQLRLLWDAKPDPCSSSLSNSFTVKHVTAVQKLLRIDEAKRRGFSLSADLFDLDLLHRLETATEHGSTVLEQQ